MNRDPSRLARQVSLVYLELAVAWILVSDRLVLALAESRAQLALLETVKGLGFVLFTAALLYFLIRRGTSALLAAQQRLEEQERRLQALLASLPGAAYRCRYDAEWTTEYISDGIEALTGYRPEELLQNRVTSFNELVHVDDRARVRRTVDEAVAEHRRFRMEYRIHDRAGRERRVREQGIALYDSEGSVEALEGFVEDITERHAAEQALRESEEKFRLLLEGASDCALVMLDADGRVQSWNTGAYHIYGYTAAEIIGQDGCRLFALETEAGGDGRAILQQAGRSGIWRGEGWVGRRDGSRFHAVIVLTALRNPDGGLRGFSLFSRDNTRHYQQEQRLRDSETRLRFIFNENPSMYFMLDADGTVDSVNDFGASQLGYRAEELIAGPVTKIIHPEDREQARQMLAAVIAEPDRVHHWELRKVRKDGEVIWVHETARAMPSGERWTLLIVCEDISRLHQLSGELEYHNRHDTLTGLLNRREFERRLTHLLEQVDNEHAGHVLCYIDLDRFLLVNETCGHGGGDELLRQVAGLLQQYVRRGDMLARLESDEFAIVFYYSDLDNARQRIERIRRQFEDYRFRWDGQHYPVSFSVGLMPLHQHSPAAAELLGLAANTCQAAKSRGGVLVYDTGDAEQQHRQQQAMWAATLNRALEEDRFLLMQQRIRPLSGETTRLCCEVLLRMRDERGGLVSPGVFIPAAERFGLAYKLDRWVINAVFDWLESEPELPGSLDFCSINLSGQSLGNEEVLADIRRRLQDSSVPARAICFEITETAAVAHYQQALAFIDELRAAGCRFALDDFGSGLSSFAYLKQLPVDILKIDGLFVRNIVDNEIDRAMVRTINELGHVMGKQTIAEFVESEAIERAVRELGVDYAQGFAVARPEPIGSPPDAPSGDTDQPERRKY